MASAPRAPFFVPPKVTTSTPTSVVKARSGRSSAAAAFDSRAPSMNTRIPREGPHLFGGVHGSELARLGHVHDERLRPMFIAPAPRLLGDEVRGELAVDRRDRQQFDACGLLGCSALVGVDVRRS